TGVDDAQDVRESHDIALEELERMGRVVGDLSELAASARPDYVRPRRLDMAAFARSAFARIEHIAEREWILDGAAEAMADADEQRLAQAVVQLAANAVRYSDEGSRIRFGVDRVLGVDGPEIHVTVQDEGLGIAPEDQRRIFERFTRVDGAGSPARGSACRSWRRSPRGTAARCACAPSPAADRPSRSCSPSSRSPRRPIRSSGRR